ncbi:hypothetical protein APHAL10511_004611 [Amanita phalloides]|nr:hypothetical protein APHAL10511_004611 [Amanita phalloides]
MVKLMNIIKAPRQRPKELPDTFDEKRKLANQREFSQRPLPGLPPPIAPAPTHPSMLPPTQQPAYQARSTPRRSRTTSHGPQPRGILKKPKESQSTPPVQASGGFAPQYTSQSWPPSSQPIYSGHHAGHLSSVKKGASHHQYIQPVHYGSNPMPIEPIERRRSTNAHNYSSTRHQASDSPVSDEDDMVRLMHIKTSNYIPAYITRVPMKPAAYALHDYLRPTKADKSGRFRTIYFDIAFDPREHDGGSIRVYERGMMQPIHRYYLEQSACTHANLTEMTIYHADSRYAMWPIRIRRKDYIRVWDVYAAIYDTFHKSIKSSDGIAEEDMLHAEPHREKRCQKSSGLYEYNRRQGLLRVDILRSHRVFAGIEQDGINYRLHLKSYVDP